MNSPTPKEHAALCRKLNEARAKVHTQKLDKSGRNQFAGYDYFELSDFLPATLAAFSEVGLCGIVSFAPDIASLTIVDTETGASTVITSPMSEAALKGCHAVQNLGAVQTYLRRYLWSAAMEISEHDAVDSAKPVENGNGKPTVKAPIAPPKKAAPERKFVERKPIVGIQPGTVQTWNTVATDMNEREWNNNTYYHVGFANGQSAFTKEKELALEAVAYSESQTPIEVQVKLNAKGTSWALENLQAVEESTGEITF